MLQKNFCAFDIDVACKLGFFFAGRVAHDRRQVDDRLRAAERTLERSRVAHVAADEVEAGQAEEKWLIRASLGPVRPSR